MRPRSPWWLGLALAAVSLVLLALGVSVGSGGWEPLGVLGTGLGASADGGNAQAAVIVWEIRWPRTAGAWLAGALLGLSGALAQGLFRNPLADPYLMGSASGAGLGVAVFLSFTGGMAPGASFPAGQWGVAGAAFIGAILAVMMTLALARGVEHTMRLLLSGVIVGMVLGALTSMLLVRDAGVTRALQGFALGTTGLVGWESVGLMAAALLVSALLSVAMARSLDALALGDAAAASLGVRLQPLRAVLVAVMAWSTAVSVSQVGLIAFIGLVAPHLVRLAAAPTHRALLALSALTGGVLLLAADVLGRWAIAPQELPVGVLTAILGGAYLLWLMHRRPA